MGEGHHQLDGREFEQAQGVGDEQGSLACYSPWGHKEQDMTEQLNNKCGKHHSSNRCIDECATVGEKKRIISNQMSKRL